MKKIIVIICALICAFLIGLNLFETYHLSKEQVPVLVYHNIVETEEEKVNDPDALTIDEFNKDLNYLDKKGYTSLSMDEYYEWKTGKRRIPSKSVLITFDDGYYSFKYLAEPSLIKHDMYATNFLIGKNTGITTPKFNSKVYGTIGLDEVNNHDEHIEYGSHTYNMHEYTSTGIRMMNASSLKEDENDLKEYKDNLFEAKYLAYPFYTYTKDYIKALKDNNYKLAFAGENEYSTKDVDNYKIPRIDASVTYEEFKDIFESNKYKNQYRNRYGNGIIRKIIVTIKRKLSVKNG